MAGACCGAPPATGSEPSGSPERRSAFPLHRCSDNDTPPTPRPHGLDGSSSLAGYQLAVVPWYCTEIDASTLTEKNMALGAESCMSALPHTAYRGSAGSPPTCRGRMCRGSGTNHWGWWLARRVLGQRHVSELGRLDTSEHWVHVPLSTGARRVNLVVRRQLSLVVEHHVTGCCDLYTDEPLPRLRSR